MSYYYSIHLTLMNKNGMVFGVFDGLHEGHRKFLSDAAARCETLFVVVTRDEIVMSLKNKKPLYPYDERVRAIGSFDPDLIIVPGDTTLGGWQVINDYRPHMVFLGYDQQEVAKELKRIGIPFIFLDPYFPEKYKSSLLGK